MEQVEGAVFVRLVSPDRKCPLPGMQMYTQLGECHAEARRTQGTTPDSRVALGHSIHS
jgi:hypothetical protein